MLIFSYTQVVCGIVGPRYPDEKLGFIPSDMTPVAVLQTIIVFCEYQEVAVR
jgi:hypothetical protein